MQDRTPHTPAETLALAERVVRAARESSQTLAVAESCTGGLVAAAITSVPGASQVFAGGVVAYSNDLKTGILHVSCGLLARSGAVSEEAARAMAEGALALPGATIGVAITGIAGPDGGTEEKPVGTVWFALARGDARTVSVHHRLQGGREAIRREAVCVALELTLQELRAGTWNA